ncbi:MAG: endolytic transglycosylase MltG [Bacteroidales bacterium]|nr:endolytic transglycosylase MltG [Bacteroidales bacterium]
MKKAVSIALIAALTVAFIAGVMVFRWYSDNKRANFSRETVLYVYPGMDANKVLRMVSDSAGVLRSRSLERAFADKHVSEYMQPGRYVIKPSSSSVYVARMLNNGWQTPTRLVLSGTMRRKGDIARKIGNQMLVDSAEVAAALNDDALLAKYGFNSVNVFSLFIPDTYEMYWTASVEEILQKQKDAYDAFWTQENVAKAEKLGLTKEQVSIVASIVKGETNYEPEMPSVAGVYLNRLRIGMLLQADPTVAYCFDYEPNRILLRHLQVDSPYNTYKYAGLPPGPIAVPTKACLNAVLNPDPHNYLYFCANSDFSGTHKFASTLSEHMRNAREFQAALNRRNASR